MPIGDVYAGVDVGSSSIRVAVIDDQGVILQVETEPLVYSQSNIDSRFVTQSSKQIWDSYQICMERIKDKLGSGLTIKSIGCAATCSMVVMKKGQDDTLHPYPADYGFSDPNENVVFWMDSRATEETRTINEILKGDSILDYYGGAFIQEMGIPKVKYLIDHIPKEDLDSIVFFDLHDFLTFMIAGGKKSENAINVSNFYNPMALDGELKGWSSSFLKRIGLTRLVDEDFKAIGRVEKSPYKSFISIPPAGSRIATADDGVVVTQGVIDCYSGWIASCGKDFSNSLTMIAGTSTCFLLSHKVSEPITGIWGPFKGVLYDHYVSEGGQSTTGKLLEHLFETHPAFKELEKLGPDVFENIEQQIQIIEEKEGSIHYLTKNMFLYGDLSGNRTPYADGDMRGVFIGESTDNSLRDLLLRYICILEFLALQTRQILSMLTKHHINKIIISGSQAKNLRFVKLLAEVTKLPVEVSDTDPRFSGVKGAAYLGLSGYKNIPLTDVIGSLNKEGTVYSPELSDGRLLRLLDVKYKVMIDMAERQRLYRSWVSTALN